jgi:predicted MFS family arabinose efflux permease
VAKTLFRDYPTRSLLGAVLIISQSFLYNAIFFTYGLVLKHFYGVSDQDVATYFFAFAAGNLLGPLLIGRLFETVGRKQMISSTYLLSGVLLAFSGYLFKIGALTAVTQTALWTIIFIASTAASAFAQYDPSSRRYSARLVIGADQGGTRPGGRYGLRRG